MKKCENLFQGIAGKNAVKLCIGSIIFVGKKEQELVQKIEQNGLKTK